MAEMVNNVYRLGRTFIGNFHVIKYCETNKMLTASLLYIEMVKGDSGHMLNKNAIFITKK